MELVLSVVFWVLIIYFLVKRSKRKKLEREALLSPPKTDNIQSSVNQAPKKVKKSKKVIWITCLSVIAVFAIIGMNVDPDLAKEKRALKEKERVEKQVVSEKIENNQSNEPIDIKSIDVTVINERDTSFTGRKRNQIEIYAPDAITKEEREIVLKNMAESYEKKGYQYIQIFLRPVTNKDYTSQFGSFGSVVYSPDGCGVSGKDCGGDKWILKASDYVLTKEDQKYMNLYIKNHKAIWADYNKTPEKYSFEQMDKLEEQFNKAMAKDLGVDPDDVPVFMIF